MGVQAADSYKAGGLFEVARRRGTDHLLPTIDLAAGKGIDEGTAPDMHFEG